MFQDWQEKIKENPQISRHLLWDVDQSTIDWLAMRKFVVRRVIERGGMNDFYALFKLYGGVEGVKEIIRELPALLSARDEALVLALFDLQKEELQCYKRRQSRDAYLNS